MTRQKKWISLAVILITLVICYFPLCHRIDVFCIQLWDEGRNVANAVEMFNNHHWFTRYFEGKPDMWELKPPLLVWFQVLSLKLFGFNELAARIPSMIFSMGTVLLLFWICIQVTGNAIAGGISAVILVSCNGYIGEHVARFGEHDVLLSFFTTALVYFWYLFIKSGSYRYFWLSCL